MNAVVQLQPSRLPLAGAIAREYELTPGQWRVLVEQTFPLAQTPEAVMMALSYCRERNLDIFKKPVHIVPMWSSALNRMVETVWPGIAEIRTTASRTGEYAGIDAVEFGPMTDQTFTGSGKSGKIEKTVHFPEWASVVVYRIVKGVRCAYHAKVFWREAYASIGKTDVPNDMWAKRPHGQLDKCVEAAALRKAFPEELGSVYAAEEMEGRTIDGELANHIQAVPQKQPPAPPPPPQANPDVEDDTYPAVDASSFLDDLDTQMSGASDAATLEEIWTELDVEAALESDSDTREIADKIKSRHMARVADDAFPGDLPEAAKNMMAG